MDNKIKSTLTVRIDKELHEKLRDIAYWGPANTLNEIVESALEIYIEHGYDFAKEESKKYEGLRKLRPGRKVG